jgi:hypothetical protein
MTSSASRAFTTQVQKASRFVRKQSALKEDRLIAQRDVDFVFEIAFFSCFIALENYIEARFISLITGNGKSDTNKFSVRVPIRSPVIAREFFYGGRTYVDLFPYKRTEELAERFFRNGYPFTGLDLSQKQELTLQHAIRNDLAHKSRASEETFRNLCTGRGIALPDRDMVVRRYLQTPFSIDETRFENHVSQLISIVNALEK